MGKDARRQRQGRQRERNELVAILHRQLGLIHTLGAMYDAGETDAAYPLATQLRVVLHSTGSSASLLQQLLELFGSDFVNTSFRPSTGVFVPEARLCGIRFNPSLMTAEFIPLGQGAPESRRSTFEAWWNETIIEDAQHNRWSRSLVVGDIANKDGGAHVDAHRPLDLDALEGGNSMGWTVDGGAGERPMANGPLLPSLRQIAWEVELTFLTRKERDKFENVSAG